MVLSEWGSPESLREEAGEEAERWLSQGRLLFQSPEGTQAPPPAPPHCLSPHRHFCPSGKRDQKAALCSGSLSEARRGSSAHKDRGREGCLQDRTLTARVAPVHACIRLAEGKMPPRNSPIPSTMWHLLDCSSGQAPGHAHKPKGRQSLRARPRGLLLLLASYLAALLQANSATLGHDLLEKALLPAPEAILVCGPAVLKKLHETQPGFHPFS